MKGALLLDVVIAQGSAIFELLAGKDETLLVRWDSLFVLDFGFNVIDGIGRFDFQSDSLAREGFNEDLHICGSFV